MTKLSPAAQAVRDAALDTYDKSIPKDDNLWALDRASVVAALRAVAMEVVLNKYQYADWQMADIIMKEIQAIADELEGAQ